MKRWLLIFPGLVIPIVGFGIPYIIRQPVTYEQVVQGVYAQNLLSSQELNQAMTAANREILENIFDQVRKKTTAYDKIRALQSINRVSFEVPKYANVDNIFKNINMNLTYILKTSINVFDQLLPSVNILHNYFALLEKVGTGANKKIFARLHQLFRSLLIALAKQRYGEAQYYQNIGYSTEALEHRLIAQGLLYRIKDTNAEAKKLFDKIEVSQPVPFIKEVEKMGIMATGGAQQYR